MEPAAPALFTFARDGSPGVDSPQALPDALFPPHTGRSSYALAFHAEGTRAAAEGQFAGLESRTARAGDTVILYATGLGPTVEAAADHWVPVATIPIVGTAIVRFGGVRAGVSQAGLVAPGLYELTVQVPAAGAGDVSVPVEIDGARSPEGVLFTIGS